MNVVYLRLLVILVSLLEDDRDTGLFATSFRVLELLVGLPVVILSVALPVLAVAGAEDRERFRYGFQRLTEVALVISLLEVLLVVVLAGPAIQLIAGDEYADAAPLLRIQALSLVPVFLAQAWTLGLVSLRRQRSVAIGNALALGAVVVLGLILIPAFGTTGAAVAGVATEALLAVCAARRRCTGASRPPCPGSASSGGRCSPPPPAPRHRSCSTSPAGSRRRSARPSSSSSPCSTARCRPRCCRRCSPR